MFRPNHFHTRAITLLVWWRVTNLTYVISSERLDIWVGISLWCFLFNGRTSPAMTSVEPPIVRALFRLNFCQVLPVVIWRLCCSAAGLLSASPVGQVAVAGADDVVRRRHRMSRARRPAGHLGRDCCLHQYVNILNRKNFLVRRLNLHRFADLLFTQISPTREWQPWKRIA